MILGILAPVITSQFESSAGLGSYWTVFALREFANSVGVGLAIAVLYWATHTRHIDITRTRGIVLATLLTTVAFTLGRIVTQSLIARSGWYFSEQGRATEVSSAILVFFLLAALLVLVAQRDRLSNSQAILLDESRRALQDDHESLRGRVFDHLHGTVQSELVVARVRILDVARDLPDGQQQEELLKVAAGLQRLKELEIRRLAHVMVASGLDTSLAEALNQLAASCDGLCDVVVRVSDEFTVIDDQSEGDQRAALRLTMFRIVEECLNNAMSHGHAQHVDVAINARSASNRHIIEIVISNDGDLVGTDAPPGMGLSVLRARAAIYDGNVRTSTVGGRFTVNATLELRD